MANIRIEKNDLILEADVADLQVIIDEAVRRIVAMSFCEPRSCIGRLSS